jgi:hypothetical protein
VHGILRLEEKYGSRRLNAACKRALNFGDAGYRTIKNILEKGLDQEISVEVPCTPLSKAFLRGPQELFATINDYTKPGEVFYGQSASITE